MVRAVASLEEAANLDVTSREVSLNIVEEVILWLRLYVNRYV